MTIKNLTSDRITQISLADPYTFPAIELLEWRTEKGMTLLVDARRFSNVKVGDQIDIHIDVVK